MSIELEDPDGIQQIVFYDAGVGTQGAIDKVMGGGFGEGIDINIKELYTFLALNYDDGDEVYLFGFSRGSYTVRSLCGLIYEAGLVRRDQLQFVAEAYELYRDNEDVESERAVAFRQEHGDRVPIKLLACFDTVGSLGLPFDTPIFSRFNSDRYTFHSTQLNPLVENAVHMLSIDEDRSVFSPTFMDHSEELGPDQVTQLYFWGGHGGVGGGDSRQTKCSDVTLRFLVDEMQRREITLALDLDKIPAGDDVDDDLGEIRSSKIMSFVEKLTGKNIREIPSVDKIHCSAIKRFQKVADWRPTALENLEDDLLNAEVQYPS